MTILATVTVDQLTEGTGRARTGTASRCSLPELLGLANDGQVLPIVLADNGAVLTIGRTRRLANRAQRLALAARDQGCTFPGCDRRPAWCQAHHVIPWVQGGATDLNNLVLVCDHHHAEFAAQGWLCRMVDGRPEWVPPAWIDPDQHPRHNTTHHHVLLAA